MGIGETPLIPLYRVQTDPEARFQRFGVNNGQLFGKSMLAVGASPLTAQKVAEKASTREAPEAKRSASMEEAWTTNPAPAATYSSRGGDHSRMNSSALVGTKVDLKA